MNNIKHIVSLIVRLIVVDIQRLVLKIRLMWTKKQQNNVEVKYQQRLKAGYDVPEDPWSTH